jgi:SAM-dependent methyltransferase
VATGYFILGGISKDAKSAVLASLGFSLWILGKDAKSPPGPTASHAAMRRQKRRRYFGNTFMQVPDWNLPPGVSRGVWDYTRDTELARRYDASLAGTPLLTTDLEFAGRHFPTPGRLIDLGCGTGRLLLPFARRGFGVVGVDLSAEMLRIVGEKAAAASVTVHRLQANLVELDGLADATFDYAACLFSTLGMIRGDTARRHVIGHAFRLLRPGGILVLHVHNRWFSLWDRAGRRWLVRDFLGLREAGEEKGTRPAGLALHHYTRREIVRSLEQEGFAVIEVQPVGLGSGRLAAAWWFSGLRAYGYLLAARKANPA